MEKKAGKLKELDKPDIALQQDDYGIGVQQIAFTFIPQAPLRRAAVSPCHVSRPLQDYTQKEDKNNFFGKKAAGAGLPSLTIIKQIEQLFDDFRMQYFPLMVWNDHAAAVLAVNSVAPFLPRQLESFVQQQIFRFLRCQSRPFLRHALMTQPEWEL